VGADFLLRATAGIQADDGFDHREARRGQTDKI
jgi:hypothetical protein